MKRRDLSDIAGTWIPDPAFDDAIAAQDQVTTPVHCAEAAHAGEPPAHQPAGGRRSGGALAILAVFGAIALWETRRPLRRRVEPRTRHFVRDVAVFAITATITSALQRAFYRPLVEKLARRKSTIFVDILLLDYALWLWHWLNHRVAFFWRFHRVHHVDRDLDTATGLRFHFGELVLSVPFRIMQVLAIRPDPLALTIWERMLMVSIVFHHSNTRLPLALEGRLARLFVTPRMHGIHHSDVQDETHSNWSSLFTIWDQIHGTFRLDVPQEAITIGVPKYENGRDVTLPRILEMPLWTTGDDFMARESRAPSHPRRGGPPPARQA